MNSRESFTADLTTPVLVVDEDKLDNNVAAMASWARRANIALRPHAKTHKTAEVAKKQLDAGAVGLSVATLGEAEAFADLGFSDLFIAYPLWADGARARRLAAIAERTRLRVGVDSPEALAMLGRSLGSGSLEVLIEIDCGHRRSGVAPDGASPVARAAERAGFTVAGVFTFPGHGYAPGMAEIAARQEATALEVATESLVADGHDIAVRSGGSTPTVRHAAAGILTELRPGSYVFNDAQQLALGSCSMKDVALCALSTVVSVSPPDRFVLDAGSKILGADRPEWLPGHGMIPGIPEATIASLSEHHAVVFLAEGRTPRLGEVIAVIPNHVCNAVNLVDELAVVSNGVMIDSWSVCARGQNT